MKIFTAIFTALVIASIAFSASKIDTSNPFEGDSVVALIMIMAALCALALVYILMTSRKIKDTLNKKK